MISKLWFLCSGICSLASFASHHPHSSPCLILFEQNHSQKTLQALDFSSQNWLDDIFKAFDLLITNLGHESLRQRELRLARISMSIVLLFILCHCPKIIPTICEIVLHDAKAWKTGLQKRIIKHCFQIIPAMVEISHLLLVLNCSLNFPVYFLASGTKFGNLFSNFGLGSSAEISQANRLDYTCTTLQFLTMER